MRYRKTDKSSWSIETGWIWATTCKRKEKKKRMLQNTWVYHSCCTGSPLKSTHQHIQGLPCLWNMSLSFLHVLWTPLTNWNGYSLSPFRVLLCFSGLCNAAVGAEIPPQDFSAWGIEKRSFSVIDNVHTHHQHGHCLKRRPALKSPLEMAECRSTTASRSNSKGDWGRKTLLVPKNCSPTPVCATHGWTELSTSEHKVSASRSWWAPGWGHNSTLLHRGAETPFSSVGCSYACPKA